MDPETARLVGKMAFDLAGDLAKQLITLSTAVLTLSITFTKDIVKEPSKGPLHLLKLSWLVYLLSICCGIWTMMALTGTLMPRNSPATGPALTFGSNVRIPAGLQILAFIVATVLIIIYGVKVLSRETTPSGTEKENGLG